MNKKQREYLQANRQYINLSGIAKAIGVEVSYFRKIFLGEWNLSAEKEQKLSNVIAKIKGKS